MRVYSLALATEIIHLANHSIDHLDVSTTSDSTTSDSTLIGSKNSDPISVGLPQLKKIVFWADDHCCQILREILVLKQWVLQPDDLSKKQYPRSDIYKQDGQQFKVVIYPLSNIGGRKFGYLLDQALIGYTAYCERVSLIHCTANTGILTTTKPQVVTVHDLYQAFTPLRHKVPPNSLQEKLRSRIFTAYYRCLFALQFYKIQHVIVDSANVARQILSIYRYPTNRLSVIRLGVERLVTDLQRNENAHLKDISEILNNRLDSTGEWPSTQTTFGATLGANSFKELADSYILLLGSRDPRKNIQRQLLAWHTCLGSTTSPPHAQKPALHLVICLPDEATRQIAQNFILDNNISPTCVSLLEAVSKPDLLTLMANASMLLNATLAEGFGLPVMECLSFGTPVVTGQLEYLKHWEEPWNRGLVYTCNTLSVNSIADAMTRCYEKHGRHWLNSGKSPSSRTPIKSARTMQHVTQETMRVYSTIYSTECSNRNTHDDPHSTK